MNSSNGCSSPSGRNQATLLENIRLSPNCLTYLLPRGHTLADKQTTKTLILRKVCDRPLLFEDVAALTYFKFGYFKDPPPNLNIRAGPKPKQPEALRELEAREQGFSFRARISLDPRFNPGGVDRDWPCYLVSGIEEIANAKEAIIQPGPSTLLSLTHKSPSYQSPSHSPPESPVPNAKRQRTAQAVSMEDLQQEIASLRQEVKDIRAHSEHLSEVEAENTRQLRREVKELRRQVANRSQLELDVGALEAGYERLLRAAYKELQEQLHTMEKKATAVMADYVHEIQELREHVQKLEGAK